MQGNGQLTAKGHSWICRLCDQVERRTKRADCWWASGADGVGGGVGSCWGSSDARTRPKRCRPSWRTSLHSVHCLLPGAAWHWWRRAGGARRRCCARRHPHFRRPELRNRPLRCFRCRRRQRPTSRQQSSCGSAWRSATKATKALALATEKTTEIASRISAHHFSPTAEDFAA